MKVKDVMTHEVQSVEPDTSLKDVAALLIERRISGVPVVNEGWVIGVVSETDILYKERGSKAGQRGFFKHVLQPRKEDFSAKLEARTAREAMTAPAITIRPDAPISEAAELMTDRRINRLPVVAIDGKLAGIVTRADLVRAFARPDSDLCHEIRELVDGRFGLSKGTVTVTVTQGEVRLAGEVSEATADGIIAKVKAVPGVVAVDSQLHG